MCLVLCTGYPRRRTDLPSLMISATIAALPTTCRPTLAVSPITFPLRFLMQLMRWSVPLMPARLSPPNSPSYKQRDSDRIHRIYECISHLSDGALQVRFRNNVSRQIVISVQKARKGETTQIHHNLQQLPVTDPMPSRRDHESVGHVRGVDAIGAFSGRLSATAARFGKALSSLYPPSHALFHCESPFVSSCRVLLTPTTSKRRAR